MKLPLATVALLLLAVAVRADDKSLAEQGIRMVPVAPPQMQQKSLEERGVDIAMAQLQLALTQFVLRDEERQLAALRAELAKWQEYSRPLWGGG